MPGGSEFILSAGAGYSNSNSDYSIMADRNLQTKSESKEMNSALLAAYGFNENLYFRISAIYSNGTNSTTNTDYAQSTYSSESESSYDGFAEPDLVLGAQIRIGMTQFFGELSVDIPMGDSVTKQIAMN